MAVHANDRRMKEIDDVLCDLRNVVRHWIENLFLSHHLFEYRQVFSSLLSISSGTQSVDQNWQNYLIILLHEKCINLPPKDLLALYTDHCSENCHPVLKTFCLEQAFDAVRSMCQDNSDIKNVIKFCSQCSSEKSKQLFDEVFKCLWENGEDAENSLRLLLEYSGYVILYCEGVKAEKQDLFSDSIRKNMMELLEVFTEVTSQIKDGRVSVKKLKWLLEHRETLLNIEQVTSSMNNSGKDGKSQITLKEVLCQQEEKLRQFEQHRHLLVLLTKMFENTQTDLSALKDKLKENEMDLLISEVTHLRIDDMTLKSAEQFEKYTVSDTFCQIWEEVSKERGCKPCSIEDAVEQIWDPAQRVFHELTEATKNGTVTFAKVRQYFGHYGNQELEDEFQKIGEIGNNSTGWIQNCSHQISQYLLYYQKKNGAEVMKNLINEFGLKGDFHVLDEIMSLDASPTSELCTFREEIVKTAQSLLDISSEKVECLKAFLECQELVRWLKKSLEDTNQIKVLVDLAMITACGQGDMEVNKVKCLHSAALGYAPLIYEFQDDISFNRFMELCKLVWRSLESDPKLPTKLRDTQANLTWLKKVKESKGSVEMNAFTEAKLINSEGIYSIGCTETTNYKSLVTFEDVLQVTIPSKVGKREKPVKYTYRQLTDLQSRLMLIAGKAAEGKEQVDHFVEILDGATRMASAYLILHNSGCIIFKKWKVTLYCEPQRTTNVQIDFGLTDKIMSARGNEDVTHQISVICDFLDDCLKDWNRHIEEMRKEFKVLNYFTMDQLVYLCEKLVLLFQHDEAIPNTVYHLLHQINKNCTLELLGQAAHDVFTAAGVKMAASDDGNESHSETASSDSEDLEEDEQITEEEKAFVDTLLESGYSKKLALEALEKFGSNELNEALTWCMVKEDESTESEEDDVPYTPGSEGHDTAHNLCTLNNHLKKSSQQLTLELFQRLELDRSELGKQLTELWNNYMRNISDSVTDVLSIKHLAHILHHLHDPDLEEINRPFPAYFKTEQPNLLICSQGEMLQVLLSLYVKDERRYWKLPQSDEVLLCCNDTTAEQVDLLLRRASSDSSGRLFCLADVGHFDYESAKKTEESFEKHRRNKSKMHLVVICTQETEYHSQTANYLEQYKVTYHPPYNLSEIQNYLKDQFTVRHDNAASSVDPDHCAVRMVKSFRAGVGKSLRVQCLQEQLRELHEERNEETIDLCVTIPIHRRKVDLSAVMRRLDQYRSNPEKHVPRIFHIDLAHEVIEGVDYFLFNLLILGSVMDKKGMVWQRSDHDLYIVETVPLLLSEIAPQGAHEDTAYAHSVLHLLPALICWSPVDCLLILSGSEDAMLETYPDWCRDKNDQLIDEKIFQSEAVQRPYQYLKRYSKGESMDTVNPRNPEDSPLDCLKILMRYCGIDNPSWAELNHFIHFLNVQLHDCELSDFCCIQELEQDLPGFRSFVVKFMINMSRDFATRSLKISEETPNMAPEQQIGHDLAQYELKRRWENSSHPYIFFNVDPETEERHTMTFLGFTVNNQGDIVDSRTQEILEENVIHHNLLQGLRNNRVQLNEAFDDLPRDQKIERLCRVMGMEYPYDPDASYELTVDNVQKILAIHMRFRCGIPVIVMGETGCGKTRLVKFMCDLQKPPGAEIENLILMKVHGGTTEDDIKKKVKKSFQLAHDNKKEFSHVDTVLFFDEANTTDAIGLLKEILCDHRMMGEPLKNDNGLKFVIACNPYRKHSDEVIKKLEQAGLGYHVKAAQTKDKLGNIPMRQLVYRVHALPQSMLPLVWDFGQLTTDVEQAYIKLMIEKYINEDRLPHDDNLIPALSLVLASSQEFMKQQEDECSFVSLRDVNRVLQVMSWFHEHKQHIFPLMDEEEKGIDDITRMLVLALGVCYHASLDKRQEYRQYISERFHAPLTLPNGPETIATEINSCQEVFMDKIELEKNIARNEALKENLFMMIMCIELRIPLFLVGKPGSSKSLAKTIVSNVMKGDAAPHEFFRNLKQVHMISFQCSPLSTPDGIVSVFKQCAELQHEKDLQHFVATVVLDEVGLAEDSPLMPLKALHPLLEDGCIDDDEPEPHKKVACIAISNWALDSAKMNRGIHVQRGVPDINELKDSARGICSRSVISHVDPLIEPLAEGYLSICGKVIQEKREFFGLRDFYSLIKMIAGFAENNNKQPTSSQLRHAILRNFGGLESIDPVAEFEATLPPQYQRTQRYLRDPFCNPISLIKANLHGDGQTMESRYLLIVTENYGALSLIEQELLDNNKTTVLFGSSFPKDQEYTQVCCNINKIKTSMETGHTVVLLNLENLYESLYDALNQYYVRMGGARFVDLGLGTQRVKCEVHKDFKLIVVAEKDVVYTKFPIPLINRFEKHLLSMSTILTQEQKVIVNELNQWIAQFVSSGHSRSNTARIEDVFIGYHPDTTAAVVIHICKMSGQNHGGDMWKAEILERSQDCLLQCATPDSVLRLRNTPLAEFADSYAERYYNYHKHGSLLELLDHEINQKNHTNTGVLLQVTTHSKLLSSSEVVRIGENLGISEQCLKFVSLHAFDTEHQFSGIIRRCLSDKTEEGEEKLLLIQCDSGDQFGNLIACARYIIQHEIGETIIERQVTHVVLLVQLSQTGRRNFVGFQGGNWISYHIDDLVPERKKKILPSLSVMCDKPLSRLFGEGMKVKRLTIDVIKSCQEILHNAGNNETMVEDGGSEENPHEDLEESSDEITGIMHDKRQSVDQVALPDWSGSDDKDLSTVCTEMQELSLASDTEEIEVSEGDSDCLDVERLVHCCLHKAVAMLKDCQADTQRKVDRISMLLHLLESNQAEERGARRIGNRRLTVLDVFNIRIHHLLIDKERTTMLTTDKWLTEEAASVAFVRKAGTFSYALQHCIESKVTPLLAALVAYSDRNRNLDLIFNVAPQNWIYTFWIMMFSDPSVTELQYSDLPTSTGKQQGKNLAEFKVETSACNKLPFSGRLPFSWIIYNQINALMYKVKSRHVREESECIIEELIQKSPIGCILCWVYKSGHKDEMIERYLHDFVHMVYSPQTSDPDKEIKLITRCIRAAYVEHSEGHSLTLAAVHLVYNQIRRRIQLCTEAMQLWPEIIERLSVGDTEDVPEVLFKLEQEMTLDVGILHVMLGELKLNKSFDTSKQIRIEWIEKVKRFHSIIERLLQSVEKVADYGECGPIYLEFCKTCRHQWTTVLSVYLFVQHVCPSEISNKITKKYKCMSLSKFLGGKADLKTEDSLTMVETFLLACNKRAKTIYFKEKTCQHCGDLIDNPIQLPCDHSICLKCVNELKDLDDTHCPECKASFPADLDPKPAAYLEQEVHEHNKYKMRCNAFFMDLVSRLCFTGTTPPEQGVIKKLMDYVICDHKMAKDTGSVKKTGPVDVFKNSIDPTPVVRSFLLQLLLRSNTEQVAQSLSAIFDRYRTLGTDAQYTRELSLLCVYCLEDHFFKVSAKQTSEEKAQYLCHLLEHNVDPLLSDMFGFDKLQAIAAVRFALAQMAELLHAKYIEGSMVEISLMTFHKLCEVTKQLCLQGPPEHLSNPSCYLMKQLFFLYGKLALQKISRVQNLKWIIPEVVKEDEEVRTDVFVSLGQEYTEIREKITQVLFGNDLQELSECIENQQNSAAVKERNILLALYREVTCELIKPETTKPDKKMIAQIGAFFQKRNKIAQQDLLGRILTNRLSGQCSHLKLADSQDDEHRILTDLLLHYWIVMNNTQQSHLAAPLWILMNNPHVMKDAYLPTMPDDHFEEIRDVLFKARGKSYRDDSELTFWKCPNGHPYVIGNCGRPKEKARCYECGANIGGKRFHEAVEGNTEYTKGKNDKRVGHVLGCAKQRPTIPVPERLNPLTNSLLRIMVHMSMYLGANRDSQSVCDLVHPSVEKDEIPEFLWQHLNHDLNVIAKALDRNPDDTVLLIHLLLGRMVCHPARAHLNTHQGGVVMDLNMRKEWETTFCQHYIMPILENFEQLLHDANHRLAIDTRLGNNLLLHIVHEVDQEHGGDVIVDAIHEERSMWSFRSRITIEQMTKSFHSITGQGTHLPQTNVIRNQSWELMELFLQREHCLRTLRYLPNIVRLQEILSEKIHLKIERADAMRMTVAEFNDRFIEKHRQQEFGELVKSFADAWDQLRGQMGHFGSNAVQVEFSESNINNETPLAVLAPNSHGPGLCAVALVQFMIQIHNDFIENYARIRNESLPSGISSQNITELHLVAYDPDKDLMPLLLANCQYTLTAGQNMKIDYDFEGLIIQIEERFIHGRPRIRPEVALISYREEATDAIIISQLQDKISQDPIDAQTQKLIFKEYYHLTELNDGLATLDIAIDFLVSVGGDPEMTLEHFIGKILKMNCDSLGKVTRTCRLRHTQSLWLLLSHQRTKLLCVAEQNGFDMIPSTYHESLDSDLAENLLEFFCQLPQLDSFLPVLYEFIMLHVGKGPASTDGEEFVDNEDHPLGEELFCYLESKEYTEMLDKFNRAFPHDVLLKHCTEAWKIAYQASNTR